MWIGNSQNVKTKFLCYLTLRCAQQVCYMCKISLLCQSISLLSEVLNVSPSEVETIKRFLQPNAPICLLLIFYYFYCPVSLQTKHWILAFVLFEMESEKEMWTWQSRKNYKKLNCSENKAVRLQSWCHLYIEAWVMIYITNIWLFEDNSEIRLC